MSRRLLVVVAVCGLVATPLALAAASVWSFTPDAGVRLPGGVSADVVPAPGGGLLAYAATPYGEQAYTSTDGLSFQSVKPALPPGSDATIVPVASGGYRLYEVNCFPNCSSDADSKNVLSATSTDALHWKPESGVRIALGSSRAAGVPDAIVLPDGRVRIYFVQNGTTGEVIDSATSTDGLHFTADPGHRLTGGFVDPSVVQLHDGSWLMAVSRTPSEQQRLFLAHSSDGLRWSAETAPVLKPEGGAEAFDPTLLPLDNGSVRVYYTHAAAGAQMSGPYTVLSGVVAPGAATVALHVVLSGHGTVTGGHVSCPGTCSATLAAGTHVTLVAKAATGYRFTGWGGACSGKTRGCTVVADAAKAVRATFAKR
jgi:hypothetical protein